MVDARGGGGEELGGLRGTGVEPETQTSHARGSQDLPDEAFAAALASLPGIGPKSLRTLLCARSPREAWEALLSGRTLPPSRPAQVVREARAIDVRAVWREHQAAGVGVSILRRPGYPETLAADHEAPPVLFSLGDPSVIDRHRRVAVVGTRSATRYGLGVAAQLGAELSASGVVVVSGLALGIDGAAHEGAVAAWHADRRTRDAAAPAEPAEPAARPDAADWTGAAPPVAVVAGSVASPYPRQHAGLWRRVAQAGAVVSEAALGCADLAWRFPMRNRIIAALADVVIVVECHAQGGSLHTVQAAASRGIPVGAVPGSVRSPASHGTNALLADGCFVVRDTADVLVALGLATASLPVRRAGRPRMRGAAVEPAAEPPAQQLSDRPATATSAPPQAIPAAVSEGDLVAPSCRAVLEALGWERCPLDDVVARTGLALDVVCSALEVLRSSGRVHGEGGWWERN
jgi:DNA processing protein